MKPSHRKALQWTGGIAATLAVAVALVIIFFEWNWLKGPLEARLESATGKQVHIDGDIEGEWAWVPHIALNKVRIEDKDWKPAPTVGTIDRIALTFDIPQFFKGNLSFPEIEIAKPVLTLERRADGKANWDIAKEANGPDDRNDTPLIGTLKVADGKGTYRDVPFTIKAQGGSLESLRDTSKPYKIDIRAAVGDTKVSAVGTVSDPFKMTDINVLLTAEGDNAEKLYPIFGIPAPSTPPYQLAGTLDRDGDAWLFKNFSGTVGKSDLSGSLKFDPTRERMFVSGSLVSKKLDFADLGLLVGAPGSTAPGRPVSDQQKMLARKAAQSDRVLPDAPLRFDEIRNVDADITLKGEHIQAPDLPLEDVDLHLKIDNAVLSMVPLKVGIAGGEVDATIVINARTDVVTTDYDVKFRKFQIQQFFESAGFPKGGTGNMDGRIRLHGKGESVRKSLATANGQAAMIVDNGTLSALASNLLGLDVARTLGLLISGDQQIPLRCMVADFDVKDGLMTPHAFILDTSATMVTGAGTIDLAAEKLNLTLRGKQKAPTPLDLGGPIEVGGMFKKPSVGLGPETVVRGGIAVALGALLTPLAAVLGFIDSGDPQNADCLALERQALDNAATPPSKSGSSAAAKKRPPAPVPAQK